MKSTIKIISIVFSSLVDAASAYEQTIEKDYLCSILKLRIQERTQVEFSSNKPDLSIFLGIDKNIGKEGFCIIDADDKTLQIIGHDLTGLLAGIGKFLHTSMFFPNGEFVPSQFRGSSVPQEVIRGVYAATHFFNWYQVAKKYEFSRYIEDLALWRVNALAAALPIRDLDGWKDLETEKSFSQIRGFSEVTSRLGLKFGIVYVPNQDFKKANQSIKAVKNDDSLCERGNHGHNICPSNPEGEIYILYCGTGYLFHKLPHFPGNWEIICLWERE